MTGPTRRIDIPVAFQDLFRPHRYKVYYGGRGGGKSWAFARALILRALERPTRILCAREFQASINDSVLHLLESQISEMGLASYFKTTRTSISASNGSEFIFKGLHHNINEIKSTEGIDICWVEEAQSVSEDSWKTLIPTIRREGSEIWISFNPLNEDDPTYQRFVVSPQPNCIVRKVSWRDIGTFFPDVLNMERLHMLQHDPDAYQHVWEGDVLRISDAVIFKGKFEVLAFETPMNARFYHGVDWGFAKDPTCLIRAYVIGNCLYIDREAWGVGVDLDDTPTLFNTIETAGSWPLKADSARPETISYMAKRGYSITGAKKWQGSVEDGIAFLRSFDRIYIHQRCRHTAENFRLYSYKTDKLTGDVLPVVLDRHNHAPDALRYAFDGLIRQRGKVKGYYRKPAGL